MKRLILLLSVIYLLSGSIVVPVSAARAEDDKGYFGLLETIDIISAEDYTDEKLSADISRGEFVGLLADAIRVKYGAFEKQYWDVDEEDEFAAQITALTKLGYISGYGDGSFGDNDLLTLNDAMIMGICVLGYKNTWTDAQIGYNAYLKKASELELGEGIKGEMNVRNAYILIYNILNAYMADIGPGGVLTITTGEDTMIYRLYGIKSNEGVVKSVGARYIAARTKASVGYVSVGTDYLAVEKDFTEFLGYKVKYFYDEEENLIYCYKLRKQETLRINAEDILGFSNMQLTYEINDRERTVEVLSGADVVYNGITVDFATEFSDSLMQPDSGYIDFIDNDNDGNYDVVMINESYNIVVQSAYRKSTNVFCITDKNDSTKNIELDSNKYLELSFIGADGNIAEPDVLYRDDVVTVFKSIKGEIIDMLVSNSKQEAIISDIESEDGISTVTIDGTEYETAADFGDELKLNKSVILCFDVFGKIAAASYIDTGEYQTGLFLKKYDNYYEKVEILMLSAADGMVNKYACASKIKIDGRLRKNNSDVIADIDSCGFTAPFPVRYRLNESGELTEIDTPHENTAEVGDTLVHRNLGNKNLWYKTTKTLSGHYIVTDDTIIFGIPSVRSNWHEYRIVSSSKLGNDKTVSVDVYSLGRDGFAATAIVMENTAFASNYGDTAVVCKKKIGLNEDDEAVWTLELFENGKSFTRFVYDTDYSLISNINVGDIIRYSNKPNDELDGVLKVYDYESERWCYTDDNGVAQTNPTSPYTNNANFRLLLGKVNEVSSGYVGLVQFNVTNVTDSDIEAYRFGDLWYVYKVDGKTMEYIRKATLDDIIEGKYSPSGASKVLMQTQYAQPRVAYIIK